MILNMKTEIESYIKIPIVGNKFQSRKPNKTDVNILLIKEDENPHDSNAVGVYSKHYIDNSSVSKLTKLGFIIRDKTSFIRENYDNIEVYKIIRSANKNDDGTYYYYILLNIINKT